MQKKPKSLRKSHLQQLQNIIRGSNNPLAAVSAARPSIRISDLRTLAHWLHCVRQGSRAVFQGQNPRRITHLATQAVLAPVPVEREIIWTSELLKYYTSQINAFLPMAQRFETHLLAGQYHTCKVVLDEIVARFGQSLWEIENRIALLQLEEGLEKQKRYASDLRAARNQNDFLSFIIFSVSHRNEDSATSGRFASNLSDQLDKWQIDSGLRSYLLFRLANRPPRDELEIASILRHEAVLPTLDLYETFISLAETTFSANTGSAARETFLSELSDLAPLVNDTRITRILFTADSPCSSLRKSFDLDLSAQDALAKGEICQAIGLAKQAREKQPLNISSWLTEGQAKAELGALEEDAATTLSARISNFVLAIAARKDTLRDAEIGLHKICLNFRLMSFVPKLESFLYHELSPDPLPHSPTGLRAFYNSPFLDPAALRYLPTSVQRETYARTLMDTYGARPAITIEMVRAMVNIPSVHLDSDAANLDPHATEAIQARLDSLIARNEFSQTLEIARKYCADGTARLRRLASRIECHCLLKLGNDEELLDRIVSLCISEPTLSQALPIRQAAAILSKDLRKQLAAKLSTPILLDLYSRGVDNTLNKPRAYAYEDFLIAHKMERPSQLAHCYELFALDQIIYYLRFLCSQAVMQSSSAYSGTRDVEDERLAVLSLLIKIDPDNGNDYRAEIRDITRNQMIRQGVRQVEQSKIFANIALISKWANSNLKESFNRYQALVKAGIGGDYPAFEDAFRKMLSGSPLPKELLEVPKNEAMDLLIQLIQALFHECTSNPEHGLDSYLSMRIRHGTLSGQLRSPLEQEKIITQRESGAHDYKSNLYWLNALPHIDHFARVAIDTRLARFSKEYDDFIDRIAKDLIQVRSKDKQQGLFDVHLTSVGAWFLVTETRETTTFDQFLDKSFELFWASVEEQCLKKIRDVIDNQLKKEVNALFDGLADDIDRLSGVSPTTYLNSAIRTAQTGAQQALDRVKAWFQLSRTLSTSELSFNDLVDIGVECVKTIHRDFDPTIIRNVPDLPLIASLTLVSDIFIIIFDNIWRHSGILRNPTVEIAVTNESDRLKIIIDNQVAPGVRTDAVEAKVHRIKQSILEGAYKTAVRSEGGTGFIKLRKIIGNTESTQPVLDFGFRDDGRFFVDLEIHVTEIRDETTSR